MALLSNVLTRPGALAANAPFAAALLLASLLLPAASPAQPASLKWFPDVKTEKDQRTLALLKAGPEGFALLRRQNARSDDDTPPLPVLTILNTEGAKLYDEILPGFADGQMRFCFATANDSLLLVTYEAPGGNGQVLYARCLRLDTRKWSGAPQALFTEPRRRAPAFATAWFHRSADDKRLCVYQLQSGQRGARAALAVFDEHFRLLWQRSTDLPAQEGPTLLRRLVCCNNGDVLLHAQLFGANAALTGPAYDAPPAAYQHNGRPLFDLYDWASETQRSANAFFLLRSQAEETASFYPNFGKKFTLSAEFMETGDGDLLCAGFTNTDNNTAADGYFVYRIDLKTQQGEFVQQAPLPGSVRKALLGAKSAAKKEAVEGLALRRFEHDATGRCWLLAERQYLQVPPGRIDEALLLRLDSTYRIGTVRMLEKFQTLPPGESQNFASLALCAAPKGGWWLLWNTGRWPDTRCMLSEFRSAGEPDTHQIDAAGHSNVTLLPQTLLPAGPGKWYVVGESEYHERIRVGVIF